MGLCRMHPMERFTLNVSPILKLFDEYGWISSFRRMTIRSVANGLYLAKPSINSILLELKSTGIMHAGNLQQHFLINIQSPGHDRPTPKLCQVLAKRVASSRTKTACGGESLSAPACSSSGLLVCINMYGGPDRRALSPLSLLNKNLDLNCTPSAL